MRKGKLGNSEKGVRLTLFPLEEAEPGREATAGKRWEGHCQGLLWDGVCICRSGEVRDKGRMERGDQALRETPRGVWIFSKRSFSRQDGCRSITNELPTRCLEAEAPQKSTRLLHPWDFPGKSTGVGCHRLLQSGALQRF